MQIVILGNHNHGTQQKTNTKDALYDGDYHDSTENINMKK